jgi:hypothetical protein
MRPQVRALPLKLCRAFVSLQAASVGGLFHFETSSRSLRRRAASTSGRRVGIECESSGFRSIALPTSKNRGWVKGC